MGKSLIIITILLTVLIFIIGCPQVVPETIKPRKVELPEVETAKVEPLKVETTKIELPKIESTKVEALKAELSEAEPNEVKPVETEPNEIEPVGVEPNRVEPDKIEPVEVEPNEVESEQVEPNEVEPDKVAPVDLEPDSPIYFHDKCAGILNNFVNGEGMVNYKTLKRKRLQLTKLLNEFAELDPKEYNSWTKEDKIAFWLNAYNIEMLKIIIDNYPIKASRILSIIWGPYSIRHIDKSIGGINKRKFIVMDEEFTLSEIEQRFFRKEFNEPRVFFALSHASISSPPLRNEPYYGRKLYEQLDDQAKKSLSSPLAFRIDRKERRVYLSAILQSTWYGKEFISKYGTNKKFKDQEPDVRAVLNFITNYISRRDVSFLELENYSVKYINYDWNLNE